MFSFFKKVLSFLFKGKEPEPRTVVDLVKDDELLLLVKRFCINAKVSIARTSIGNSFVVFVSYSSGVTTSVAIDPHICERALELVFYEIERSARDMEALKISDKDLLEQSIRHLGDVLNDRVGQILRENPGNKLWLEWRERNSKIQRVRYGF